MDFTRKYRPTNLGQLAGQKAVVSVLRSLIGPGFTSGSLLLHGPPGVGKTTVARIIAMMLNCEERGTDPCGKCRSCTGIMNGSHLDVDEVNAAKNRGINEARSFDDRIVMSPMTAPFKVLILDEAHALTREAQDSLLKPIEEPPRNVCIILCSTEPNKIKKTIRDRCKQFKFVDVSWRDIFNFLVMVARDEDEDEFLTRDNILVKIAQSADGSPRIALNKLQQVLLSDRSNEVISDILSAIDEDDAGAISLCRKLCNTNSNTRWKDIVAVYKEVSSKTHPEAARIILCGYMRAIMEKTESFERLLTFSACLDIFLEPLPEVKPENTFVNNLFKSYSILKVKRNNDWTGKQR